MLKSKSTFYNSLGKGPVRVCASRVGACWFFTRPLGMYAYLIPVGCSPGTFWYVCWGADAGCFSSWTSLNVCLYHLYSYVSSVSLVCDLHIPIERFTWGSAQWSWVQSPGTLLLRSSKCFSSSSWVVCWGLSCGSNVACPSLVEAFKESVWKMVFLELFIVIGAKRELSKKVSSVKLSSESELSEFSEFRKWVQ